jgi:hypothetical protein
MTVNGAAYELPTWEPATDASASSSLLLTPVASEGEKATFQQGSARRALTGQPFLTNQIRDVYDLNTRMLPPPTVSDTNGAGKHGDGGLDLRTAVSLLPTPKAGDGEFVSGTTSGRPVEKSTHLGTIALLQAGKLEHRRTGANTSPQSDAGKQLWEDVPLPLLNQLAAMTDTD